MGQAVGYGGEDPGDVLGVVEVSLMVMLLGVRLLVMEVKTQVTFWGW